MDDAVAVRAIERTGNLRGDLDHLRQRDGTLPQPLGEGLTRQQRHDQIVDVALDPDVMEGADVWMIERGEQPRLAFEALARIGIGLTERGQHLDRHRPIETGIAGFVHLTHAAGTQRRDDVVRAKLRASGKWQGENYRSGPRPARLSVA